MLVVCIVFFFFTLFYVLVFSLILMLPFCKCNPMQVKTVFLPTEKPLTLEACAPLIATLPLEVSIYEFSNICINFSFTSIGS